MPYLGRPVTNTGFFEVIDDISSGFDGSDVSFTLQVGGTDVLPDASNLTVVLDGVVQIPSSAYSVTGSTINFSEAPENGVQFHGVLAGSSQFVESSIIVDSMVKSTANISGSKINTDFSAQTVKAAIFDGMISGSAQLADDISGSFSKEHLGAKVANVVTSSAQLAADISGSLSNTAIANLEAGIVSGSSQLATDISGSFGNQRVGTSDSPTFAGGTITGDFAVGGTLTAQEVHTEFESASILFTSGSTQFGNSSDDVHDFLGNTISGSATSTGSFGSVVVPGNVDFNGNLDVDGTTNLDNTDIDGTLTVDGGNIVFNEDSADQDFRVESNGDANMLFVDGGNNRVGIGTGSPDSILDINSGASAESSADAGAITVTSQNSGVVTALRLRHEDASGGGTDADEGIAIKFQGYDGSNFRNMAQISVLANDAVGSSDSDGNIVFSTTTSGGTALSEKMRIAESGNVGIGTAAPDAKLKVEEDTHGANVQIKMRAQNDSGAGRTFAITADPDARTVNIGEAGNGFFIDSDGTSDKVGIGNVPSPAEPLHVSGSDSGIRIEAKSGTRGTLSFVDASGNIEGKIMSNGNGDLRIGGGSSANDDIVIDNAGNVGIGDTSPSAPLEVSAGSGAGQGSIGYNGTLIAASSASAQEYDGSLSSTWGPKVSISNETASSTRTAASLVFAHRNGSSGVAAIVSTNAATDRGDLRFITRGAGNAIAERVRIDDDGKVGIGCSDQEATLQVNTGVTDATIGAIDVGYGIEFNGGDGGHVGMGVIDGTSGRGMNRGFIGFRGAGAGGSGISHIVFGTSAASGDAPIERMRIQTNGTVLVDQNSNENAFNIDAESTTENVMTFVTPTTTTATVFAAVNANSLTTGRVGYFHSDSSDTNTRTLVAIQNDSSAATGALPLVVQQDANNVTCRFDSVRGDLSNDILRLNAVGRSSTNNFSFLVTFTDGDDDFQHAMKGDGTLVADGAYDSSGADYAEYFESKDGSAIAVGTTVKLDGDKIVSCSIGDTPLGVIRPKNSSATVGNTATFRWAEKYLKDDYGGFQMEQHTITSWDTGSSASDGVVGNETIQYHTDRIPSDVTVPSDAEIISTEDGGTPLMRRKLNPNYSSSFTYVSREDRDEWNIVGLLGQIPITKGQPTGSQWTKMKDISDTVELWFVK